MDMDMASTATATALPPAHTTMSAMPPMMPGTMSSTFSINTHVTLFFTDWTTTTPAAYAFTILFLFCLGLLNRFLGALKTQLERRWGEPQVRAPPPPLREKSVTSHAHTRGHSRSWSRRLRPEPPLRLEDEEQETVPLSPAPVESEMLALAEPDRGAGKRGFWIPSGPWGIRRDGARALLEFSRALIGYVLMLAVMTYNVGFFFAVTGSVLLGELAFGRYTPGAKGWQEGGCHE
ncbi:Ctr copper transporter family-domain-containing protein [Massariosphaeria phaeospora]|uniref:Copper transport protein n=1 Tax=Massariosphaeria phaeospora TaxID=100035 RepID=A0A7C8I2I9_9PLEO|nr:Ctr copper transporter family-domain-containing protein [Massariosphaeria phaeospora]